MAVYFAQKSANIDAVNMWNTQANGSGSYLDWPPAQGDVLMANGKTITVNVSVDLGGTGEVRNGNINGATGGGYFELTNGTTVIASVPVGNGSTPCVRHSGAFPSTAYVVGNCFGGSTSNSTGCTNTGSGTLSITGTCTGGSTSNSGFAANNTGSGLLQIVGNCIGGQSPSAHGANNGSTGSLEIVGNCTGGSSASAYGANNNSTGLMVINGNVINGGGSTNAQGANNASTGIAKINGYCYSSTSGHPAYTGAFRLSPTSRIYSRDHNLVELSLCVTDPPADYLPATRDVRAGVAYAFGLMAGSCNVPPAQSVLSGVPVDATTGTALLDAEDIRAAIGLASANLDSQLSGIPDAIRTELSQELANLDEPISAAKSLTTETLEAIIAAMPDGLSAADVWGYLSRSLTEAPVVPTPEEIAGAVRVELNDELSRVSNCATVASTGAQLAALV